MSCKEYYLDDVVAVVAIPVDDFDFSPYFSPLTATIGSGDFAPPFTNAITIGRQRATDNGTEFGELIRLRPGTGKAKDDPADSVAGRKHTVTVSCYADDRDPEAWTLLRRLERTPSHLLLTFRGGQRAFVAATEDTYRCDVGRDGGKTQVQLRIECMAGMQLIQ